MGTIMRSRSSAKRYKKIEQSSTRKRVLVLGSLTTLLMCLAVLLRSRLILNGAASPSKNGSDNLRVGQKQTIKKEHTTVKEKQTYHYNEITYTDVGWFHSDHKIGLQYHRSLVGTDFMNAVQSHKRFNVSSWTDLSVNPDPSRPILAFLDVDVCNTWHWPVFGAGPVAASDLDGGRAPMTGWSKSFDGVCHAIQQALQSPSMSANESRLVIVTCQDSERDALHFLNCTKGNRDEKIYKKLVIGYMSCHKDVAHPHDFGIPPWPVRTASLNSKQLLDIEECNHNSRDNLLSFTGRPRLKFPEFQSYFEPLDGSNGVKADFGFAHYHHSKVINEGGGKVLAPLLPEEQRHNDYYQSLMNSYFVPTPRGDDLYSVRFSEVLSAGAIPIVYADGWVLPYNKDVVDWSELAVLLPQNRVNDTMSILESISEHDRCKMQQKALRVFNDYVADSHGRLRAILKIMDARLNLQSDETITKFSAAPSG